MTAEYDERNAKMETLIEQIRDKPLAEQMLAIWQAADDDPALLHPRTWAFVKWGAENVTRPDWFDAIAEAKRRYREQKENNDGSPDNPP